MWTRREFLKVMTLSSIAASGLHARSDQVRPNILMLMSDNHSWNHLGCYGDPVVRTPHIDALADEGVLFNHAYCAAPSCSPARAGILTGQDIWRLEEGANLWSVLPDKFEVYPDLLAESGYFVGKQGKGWGPGSIELSGRAFNHAGQSYESFEQFLQANSERKPFCYWLSTNDPHRPYTVGAGRQAGLDPSAVEVPPYLVDHAAVRNDICDYYTEVEQFDTLVGDTISTLQELGYAENTLIVVCSDNGWQMPRGLANLYDSGTRVPLILSWPGRIPGDRVIDDFVNLNDLAPTFLELASCTIPDHMTASSLTDLLFSKRSGQLNPSRDAVYLARERHALCRAYGVGYPGRAIRTQDYLYIRNDAPERWPAGDPPLYGDVDAHMLHYPCPTKMYMLTHRNNPNVQPLFELGFGKRPSEELYDLNTDPHQMKNLAGNARYLPVKQKLVSRLDTYLYETGDPRATGEKVIWDTTMYYQPRDFMPRPSQEAIDQLGLKEQYTYF